jgi:hypothetical protein
MEPWTIAIVVGENPQGTTIPIENRGEQAEEAQAGPETTPHLLPKRQVEELRSRWSRIQTNFIDEPRRAVKDADSLVASAIKQISEVFTDQRSQMEKQWSRGDENSTEDLRLALQQYRAFFSRLLSI